MFFENQNLIIGLDEKCVIFKLPRLIIGFNVSAHLCHPYQRWHSIKTSSAQKRLSSFFNMYAVYFCSIILILVSPICGLGPITLATKYERNSLGPVFFPQSLNAKGQAKSVAIPSSPLSLLTSDRMKADSRPICPQFSLTYAAVQKATKFLIRKNQGIEKRYKTCKANVWATGCDAKRKKDFVPTVNQCVKAHSFGACFVAIAIFHRLDWIHFSCIAFLKSSKVGNCYVLEYLTLNGYRGNNNNLVFYREVGIYNKKSFQCTAGKRAKLALPKNRLLCRDRFRITLAQVGQVHLCANPGVTRASTIYANCLGLAKDVYGSLQCYNDFVYNFNIAFINCIVPYGVDAVAVASASIGGSAVECPAFRRDSWVGPCKAGDYVQLQRLKLITTNNKGNLVFKRPGLCKY